MKVSINKTSSISNFKQRVRPALTKVELKNIKNVPCACCGNKIITTEQITKAFASITLPLKQMIKKGFMGYWLENPNVKFLLESFVDSYPEKSFDKILEDPENYAKFRESITMSDSREKGHAMQNIVTRSRHDLRGAGSVMKRLKAFKPYLKGTKLGVFEQLEIYARKYPRKRLTEILNLEEVSKFHTIKDLLQRAETKEKRDFYFENIEIMLKKASIDDEQIQELKEQALEYFCAERYPSYKVFMIKNMYGKFCEENNCQNLSSKINDEIDKMPTTFTTVDSFLIYAKNHEFSDAQIVYSLLNPYEGSFEHIVPKSKGQDDSIYNGIVLCRRCNKRRSSIPYTEFIQYHPQMPYNTQKQVNFLADLILTGEIPEMYKEWPIKIARSLYDYTDGKINVDVSSYCKKVADKAGKRIAARNNAIEKMREAKVEKLSRKQNLLKELQEIESSVSVMSDGVKLLQKENGRDNYMIGVSKNYINQGNNPTPKETKNPKK